MLHKRWNRWSLPNKMFLKKEQESKVSFLNCIIFLSLPKQIQNFEIDIKSRFHIKTSKSEQNCEILSIIWKKWFFICYQGMKGLGEKYLNALLNLSIHRFSFVFHDKAKRTQQGNLLWEKSSNGRLICFCKKLDVIWHCVASITLHGNW